MKIVDSIPGRQYYPWGEWFDGQVRLLEQGTDFTCDPAGIRSAAYAAAKKAGIRVIARVRPEGVYIHALPASYTVKPVTAAVGAGAGAATGGEGQDGEDSRRQVA